MTTPYAHKSIWWKLYHGETSFDFVGKTRRWLTISAVVILIGLIALFVRGLNFGIDFRGGTAWEVPTTKPSVAAARDAVRPLGLAEAKITQIGSGSNAVIRVQADPQSGTPEERKAKQAQITDALASKFGIDASKVSVNEVGPTWGTDISRKAARALVIFLLLITGYISLRFEWKMAVAALAALAHDILITVGIYALSGFEVTPATVVAFLTILGYSLYDTIVVFDKVEENTRGLASTGRMTYSDMVNLSMNQVLMRSLNTSFVAIIPIMSILFVGAFLLGATTLQDFGLALLIGLLTGAYSSIFIASPVLAWLKEKEPRYATIRQRLAGRGGVAVPLTPAAAALAAGGGSLRVSAEEDDVGPVPVGAGGSAGARGTAGGATPKPRKAPAPRPRKKGKRR